MYYWSDVLTLTQERGKLKGPENSETLHEIKGLVFCNLCDKKCFNSLFLEVMWLQAKVTGLFAFEHKKGVWGRSFFSIWDINMISISWNRRWVYINILPLREEFWYFSLKGRASLFLGQNQNKECSGFSASRKRGRKSHFLSSSKICSWESLKYLFILKWKWWPLLKTPSVSSKEWYSFTRIECLGERVENPPNYWLMYLFVYFFLKIYFVLCSEREI